MEWLEKSIEPEEFGPNSWLVDDMYQQYQENPASVGEQWREFFADYHPNSPAPRPRAESGEAPARADGAARAETPPIAAVPAKAAPSRPTELPEGAVPLRGVSARIAENMEASLSVPTATSVRSIPAKLLEENRRIINRYLAQRRGGKVSFTHLIGFAIVRGLEARPAMKASFIESGGEPYLVQNKQVNFGLAVDIEKKDGSRVLYVPNIKDAQDLDFAGFWGCYEDLIKKVRANKLTPEDFAGTTVTLTNPGTVGTALSVPRLMKAQGLIVGTGAIQYPPEYEAADPRSLAEIAVSKVITITSTYDHRVIQGAESGEFLNYIHQLLLGTDRFYDEIFASLKIPYEPVRWSRDVSSMDNVDLALEKQSRVIQLINMYRVRGHLLAELNPIAYEVLSYPELDLSHYGLTVWDLDREFLTDGLLGEHKMSLREIIDTLRDAYCGTVGIEYMHISEVEQKNWIRERAETKPEPLTRDDKKHVLDRLNAAEAFERFLHSKYPGNKRFSLEGAESVIPMLDAVLEDAANDGLLEAVIGMSHRGRLNVLANIVGKPLSGIFKEFEGSIDPESVQGSGDVKYHLGMTGRFEARSGEALGVVLASNPSHLEAVDPVVVGMARAKQDLLGVGFHGKVLPILLHGDAAFAGQGVVAETLQLSEVNGYRAGGTIHIVVNNQIGFTTPPKFGRSTTYATDIAKMIQAPILHVNGDDPEACVGVIHLAFQYRQEFGKDIVIDLVCFRRHGHNEGDEPAYTQPLMYSKIEERRTVRKLYLESLLNTGQLTVEEAEQSFEDFRQLLHGAFEETRSTVQKQEAIDVLPRPSEDLEPLVETGVERSRLEHIHKTMTTFPEGFEPHPKLKRQVEKRQGILQNDAVDWAAGEALAFGSLLLEGFRVRLAGQDARRGTFSQRHSVFIDYRTEEEYAPLQNLGPDQASFRSLDSILSEFAVMGFEYGYSIANGDALVCWEGQFGDFVNGAQVVVDQFIAAGEDKWQQASGLVLLLPHGYEGQGPEHSSARLERFLTLSAEHNLQVAQPTTAAQYFHLLRRQMHRSVRKPLIVLTPKSLLRSKASASKTTEFESGPFRETLDDPSIQDRAAVKRVVFCSGKIAYPLLEARDEEKKPVAIVRLEQLYPFPASQLEDILSSYPNADEVTWVQDEPENMGAWAFVHSKMAAGGPTTDGHALTHVARHESASPATGSQKIHEQEQNELVEKALSI
ncbi:MAG: multifunctional oxoglutarate decarboxylase/oxoglutarate dehydrogenase thiamine pyrophosphate-binding subunit/dihydrolipoyllysine-residue succinyltransferase subunit [Actinomycetota bacterium]